MLLTWRRRVTADAVLLAAYAMIWEIVPGQVVVRAPVPLGDVALTNR